MERGCVLKVGIGPVLPDGGAFLGVEDAQVLIARGCQRDRFNKGASQEFVEIPPDGLGRPIGVPGKDLARAALKPVLGRVGVLVLKGEDRTICTDAAGFNQAVQRLFAQGVSLVWKRIRLRMLHMGAGVQGESDRREDEAVEKGRCEHGESDRGQYTELVLLSRQASRQWLPFYTPDPSMLGSIFPSPSPRLHVVHGGSIDPSKTTSYLQSMESARPLQEVEYTCHKKQ